MVRMNKRYLLVSFLSLLLSLWSSSSLQAQVIAPGKGGAHLVGGAFFSDYSPDYGPNRLYGIGGFLDFNLRNHIGVEGEVRPPISAGCTRSAWPNARWR